VFCEIIDGRRPAFVIERDEHALVFLDHSPLFPGHCLVVPIEHHATLTDLPAASIAPFFERVQHVTRAVTSAMSAAGTFVAVNNTVSQSVPHLHVHVVPRNRKDGLKGFFWPRYRYKGPDEMSAVRQRIVDWLSAHPREGRRTSDE
jgi:histidine triad (HIT) family protein